MDAVHELHHDVATEVVVTATALTIVVGAELAKPDLAPNGCTWCEDNGLDRGARNALRWNDTRTAAHVSDVMGFVIAPATSAVTLAAAAANDDASKKTGVDLLLTLETATLAGALNEVAKFAFGRERPFVHALPPGEKPKTPHPSDNDLSFYSGHTASTFALAAGGGTIATLRGYRLAPLVWSSGAVIAATTGYLRIAADKHWLSDVLVGAAIGSGLGLVMPYLHRDSFERASPATTMPLLGYAGVL